MIIYLILLGMLVFFIGMLFVLAQRLEDELLYKMSRQPLSEIEDVHPDTAVKIRGKIAATRTFKSAFNHLDCVYYRSSGGSQQFGTRSETAPFFVEDKTGKIIVDLHGAEPAWLDGERSAFSPEYPDEFKMFDATLVRKHRAAEEMMIFAGANVVVYGMARNAKSGLIIKHEADHPLVITMKTEGEFLANKREDDRFQIIIGYGLMVIGSAVITMGWI